MNEIITEEQKAQDEAFKKRLEVLLDSYKWNSKCNAALPKLSEFIVEELHSLEKLNAWVNKAF
jgi:energy-converting hydrogenase A subunit M